VTGLIVLNLLRNRGRTVLTAVGIAIGVSTIVALLALTQGLKQSAAGLSHLGGASLGIFQGGIAEPTASVLPRSLVSRVRGQPGVEDAAPIQLITAAIPASASSILFGVAPNSFVRRRLVLTQGHPPHGDQVIVGDALASRLGLGAGGSVDLQGRRFPVAAIFHGGVSFEDNGVVMPIGAAQRLAGRRGSITTIAVTLKPDASARSVATELGQAFPGTITISNPEEAARADPSFQIITKAVLVIAVLALILGGIAVTNTIAMAVLERGGELALLSAIGWNQRQIASLIVGEGAGVGLVGACLGIIGGIVISRAIVSLLGASGFVSPVLTLWGVGRGLLIGLVIGVLGGIYPAWRISRRPPAELLGRF
jgi:putative ABC transport system permease protein